MDSWNLISSNYFLVRVTPTGFLDPPGGLWAKGEDVRTRLLNVLHSIVSPLLNVLSTFLKKKKNHCCFNLGMFIFIKTTITVIIHGVTALGGGEYIIVIFILLNNASSVCAYYNMLQFKQFFYRCSRMNHIKDLVYVSKYT